MVFFGLNMFWSSPVEFKMIQRRKKDGGTPPLNGQLKLRQEAWFVLCLFCEIVRHTLMEQSTVFKEKRLQIKVEWAQICPRFYLNVWFRFVIELDKIQDDISSWCFNKILRTCSCSNLNVFGCACIPILTCARLPVCPPAWPSVPVSLRIVNATSTSWV